MATSFEDEDECLVEIPFRLPLGEVERLTRILERARRSSEAAPPLPAPETADRLADFARFLLHMRRKRERAFAGIEFGEPTWDMILDLYVQHVAGQPVSVSSLCAASAVPSTTAFRWIDVMVSAGHLIRSPDPADGRRVRIGMAPTLISAVEAFLADMRARALRVLL